MTMQRNKTHTWNKYYPCSKKEYNQMRKIDKVQLDVMETLKGCKLEPEQVINVMLSIAYFTSAEINQEPIKAIHDALEELQYWRVNE